MTLEWSYFFSLAVLRRNYCALNFGENIFSRRHIDLWAELRQGINSFVENAEILKLAVWSWACP